jgi:hypothetical protein
MRSFIRNRTLRTGILLILFLLADAAPGDYRIDAYTIDNGGGTSSGGQYIVTGTIGQHDSSYSESEQYELLGGFWPLGASCVVELEDFAGFAQYWLYADDCPADIFDDDTVNFNDLLEFVDLWLCYCPYGWPLR